MIFFSFLLTLGPRSETVCYSPVDLIRVVYLVLSETLSVGLFIIVAQGNSYPDCHFISVF